MKRSRTKCPDDFTGEVVASCLDACHELMEPQLKECLSGGQLIPYNWTKNEQDRDAMFLFRGLLEKLLKVNPSGVFNKKPVEAGLQIWSANHGDPLTRNRPPVFLKDQAYNLVHMLQLIRDIRKSTTKGTKLPGWLYSLTQLLNVCADADDDDDDDDPGGWKSQEPDTAVLEEYEPEPKQPKSMLVPGHPFESKMQEIAQKSKNRKRCILRRHSTETSVCSSALSDTPTKFYPDPAEAHSAHDDPGDPKVEPGPSTSTSPIFWFSDALGDAFKLHKGKEIQASSKAVHENGFLLFLFPDGDSWLSEIPALGHSQESYSGGPKKKRLQKKPAMSSEHALSSEPAMESDQPAAASTCPPVLKKPAQSAKKVQKSDSLSEYNRVYSKHYHRAVSAYRTLCQERGQEFDKEHSKALGKEAGKNAVASLGK